MGVKVREEGGVVGQREVWKQEYEWIMNKGKNGRGYWGRGQGRGEERVLGTEEGRGC